MVGELDREVLGVGIQDGDPQSREGLGSAPLEGQGAFGGCGVVGLGAVLALLCHGGDRWVSDGGDDDPVVLSEHRQVGE